MCVSASWTQRQQPPSHTHKAPRTFGNITTFATFAAKLNTNTTSAMMNRMHAMTLSPSASLWYGKMWRMDETTAVPVTMPYHCQEKYLRKVRDQPLRTSGAHHGPT